MKTVEACAEDECSHFGKTVDNKDFCTKELRTIARTSEEKEVSAIPSWCPLPES